MKKMGSFRQLPIILKFLSVSSDFLKNTKLPENYQAKGLQLVDDQLRYDNMDAATKIKYNKFQKNLLVSKDMLEDAWETGLLQGEETES